MIQNTDTQMLLYRARLLLEEGQNEAALAVLQAIRTEDEKQLRDIAYLLAWCYIQRKQWDDAIRALSPLLEQIDDKGEQATLLERERLALYLLRLGLAAVALAHFDDASQHFTFCLKVLHDRRVHLPAVRVKARYSLAMTCIMRGLYTAAVQHYEEALRLCRHYHLEEELPNIYYGLADAYRHIGDYIKAYSAGQEALRLYEEMANRQQEASTHNMLGRISFLLGDYREAADHYTESLALATSYQGSTMAMLNCAALADLRLAEGRLDEAKRYCHLALDTMERTDDPYCQGGTYHIIGKVVQEEARQSVDTQRLKLFEEAIKLFEKAQEKFALTQAYPDMAEVYGCRAQALEDLGRVEEAIECWRSGYEILSQQKLSANAK